MFNENLNNKLEMFDLVHILTLVVFVLIIILFFVFRKKISNDKFAKVFRIALGAFLLVFESSFHIWVLTRGGYGAGMIPLVGFCATVNLLTIIALLFNKIKMFNYLIYYALTGALFSLVFVDTSFTIPHFRFFHYFLVHFGFLLASLYYYFTKKIEVNWRNFLTAVIMLFVYNLVILALDLIFKQNWFYLIENPIPEISNALGAPLYTILWIITILGLLFLWFLILGGFKLKERIKSRK